MKRVIVGVVSTLVLGLALPASAHVNRFNAKDVGFIVVDSVRTGGKIQCDVGEQFVVRVRVSQKEAVTGAETFRGTGTDKGDCTPFLQVWQVVTDDNLGIPQEGRATLTARAFTELGGVIHGPIAKYQAIIELQR